MLGALAPFVPFVLWGAAVVAFWSIDRTAGVRTLTFWSLAAGLAAAAGAELDPRTLARGVALLFLAVVAGSLAAALLAPARRHHGLRRRHGGAWPLPAQERLRLVLRPRPRLVGRDPPRARPARSPPQSP